MSLSYAFKVLLASLADLRFVAGKFGDNKFSPADQGWRPNGMYAMADQMIFSGAPSQACNLPAVLQGSIVAVIIGAVHLCALNYFSLHKNLLLAQIGAVLIGVGLPFVKTAFTRIVIDTARITWTQGILHRHESTLGLSRIQRITSIHPWWQRLFGAGSIILATDDIAHPVRRLPAIRGVDQLCRALGEAVAMHREPPTSAYTNDLNAAARSSVSTYTVSQL